MGGAGAGAARRGGSAPGGMFRKARRVNVRKRNDSEEEDEERDEEPPQEPAPASGAGGEGPAEASAVALAAAGTGLLPLPPGCVPLALPGSPAAFACAAGYGAALGLGLGLMGGDRAGLGALPAPSLLPPPPPPPPQGNGLPATARPKEKKRARENKEVPRASLLSFQDEEEGEAAVAGLNLRRGSVILRQWSGRGTWAVRGCGQPSWRQGCAGRERPVGGTGMCSLVSLWFSGVSYYHSTPTWEGSTGVTDSSSWLHSCPE